MQQSTDDENFEALKQFDTCILADAIETCDVRLRNQGYTQPGLRCVNGEFAPVIGYAVTARVKTSNPPVLGNSFLSDHEWWPAIERWPIPRIIAIQDVDANPGLGASVGQVAAAILQSLHCVGVVTNGAVRDLHAVAKMGLPLFARHVLPSHAYAHLVDHFQPVEICGLAIRSGDLLMADCHGVVSIPLELLPRLPKIADDLLRRKRKIIDFCRSSEFSLEKLREITSA